jgi:hypothetical protein
MFMDIIEEEIQKFVDRYAGNEDVRRAMQIDLSLFSVRVIQDFRRMMAVEDMTYTPEENNYDKKRVA